MEMEQIASEAQLTVRPRRRRWRYGIPGGPGDGLVADGIGKQRGRRSDQGNERYDASTYDWPNPTAGCRGPEAVDPAGARWHLGATG